MMIKLCGSCSDSPPVSAAVTVVPPVSSFTITSNQFAYLIDTTLGNGTATLPANPVNGERHNVMNTGSGGNLLTVARNGKNINNVAADYILADNEPVTLQFSSAQNSWFLTS